jgi:hypothetical protein
MSPVVTFSHEELRAQRRMVLAELRMSEGDFAIARSTRTLTGPEWQAKENLDTIDFLLGETVDFDDA